MVRRDDELLSRRSLKSPDTIRWLTKRVWSSSTLARLKMLFDFLVVGQVVPTNPAASVRGPKHVVKKGTTPVLVKDEMRHLLESIDASHVVGLRDRALIGLMAFSFARIGAAVSLRV